MGSKAKELKAFVERVLVDEGVARPYEFSIAANAHQQVIFYVKGVKVKYQFPFSPSDYRSMLNSRSSVRKAIRTAAGFALSGGPSQRPLLDAGSVLPGKPHDVGAGRARAYPNPPAFSYAGPTRFHPAHKARSRA